jgi:hypothetical protein
MLVNGTERFVLAHEYGHALIDHLRLPLGGHPAPAANATTGPWDRELRADAFGFVAVSQSSWTLDLLPSNMALQGAILAMKAHEIFDAAVEIARAGQATHAEGSASHPPFRQRMDLLERIYREGHPDPAAAPDDLEGMLVPSTTLDQIWERVAPRLLAEFRAGRALHEIWSR